MGTDWFRKAYAGSHSPQQWKQRLIGLAIAVALHVVAIWWLLQFGAVRGQLIEAAPIMVNFITPPPIAKPPKPAEPLRPKSKSITKMPQPIKKTVEAAPVLATKAIEAPVSRMASEPASKQPEAVPVEAPPPVPLPPDPPAVTLPEFNAAYLDNPPPAYPAQSKRRHEEGKVLLRVYVNAAGTAEKVELHASSGWPRLDHAALETVRSWRFVPAKQGNKAVAAWVIVPINFTVEN